MLSKKGRSIYKNLLRKLAKDEVGSHKAKVFCTVLLLLIDEQIPLSLVQALYERKTIIPMENIVDPDQLSKDAKEEIAKMMEDFSLEEE